MLQNSQGFYGFSRVALNPAVFDFDMFDHLTMGEKDLQLEVIGLFRLQVEQTLDLIETVIISKDWVALCHTLRGAAASVGATAIVAQLQDWETAKVPDENARQRNHERLASLATQYFADVQRVLQPAGAKARATVTDLFSKG